MKNLVSKLTSRKFWAAVAAFVSQLCIFAGAGSDNAVKVAALIMSGATVIAYIVGQGIVDGAEAANKPDPQDDTAGDGEQ